MARSRGSRRSYGSGPAGPGRARSASARLGRERFELAGELARCGPPSCAACGAAATARGSRSALMPSGDRERTRAASRRPHLVDGPWRVEAPVRRHRPTSPASRWARWPSACRWRSGPRRTPRPGAVPTPPPRPTPRRPRARRRGGAARAARASATRPRASVGDGGQPRHRPAPRRPRTRASTRPGGPRRGRARCR